MLFVGNLFGLKIQKFLHMSIYIRISIYRFYSEIRLRLSTLIKILIAALIIFIHIYTFYCESPSGKIMIITLSKLAHKISQSSSIILLLFFMRSRCIGLSNSHCRSIMCSTAELVRSTFSQQLLLLQYFFFLFFGFFMSSVHSNPIKLKSESRH